MNKTFWRVSDMARSIKQLEYDLKRKQSRVKAIQAELDREKKDVAAIQAEMKAAKGKK